MNAMVTARITSVGTQEMVWPAGSAWNAPPLMLYCVIVANAMSTSSEVQFRSPTLLMNPAASVEAVRQAPGPLPATVNASAGPPMSAGDGETGLRVDSEHATASPRTTTDANVVSVRGRVERTDARFSRTALLHDVT